MKNYLKSIFNRFFRVHLELSSLNIEINNLSIALCKEKIRSNEMKQTLEFMAKDYVELSKITDKYRPAYIELMNNKTVIVKDVIEHKINLTDAKIEAYIMLRGLK